MDGPSFEWCEHDDLGEVAAKGTMATADPAGLEAVPMSVQRTLRDIREVANLEQAKGIR